MFRYLNRDSLLFLGIAMIPTIDVHSKGVYPNHPPFSQVVKPILNHHWPIWALWNIEQLGGVGFTMDHYKDPITDGAHEAIRARCNWHSQETSVSGIWVCLTSKLIFNHHFPIKPFMFWAYPSHFPSGRKPREKNAIISLHMFFPVPSGVPGSKMLHIETIAAVVQPFGFGVSISQIGWILSAVHRSITRVAVENPQIPRSKKNDGSFSWNKSGI